MVYLTQLIFLREGKEAVFHEFEDGTIPLMAEYDGRLIQRLRPDTTAYVASAEEQPYEIHLISFPSDERFEAFMNDPRRREVAHLKDASVRSTVLVKGSAL